ncbi:hypothetical protein DTO166G5_6882 [Paecilomyces variotii]|nr:hypothetical protein DTO166G5_6882 [Paecilomyces variotii]
MSLVQHVSSIDGVDREHVPSSQEPAGSIRRQLSYDAFPRKTNPKDDQVGIPAYKVSVAKRVAQVTATILACWFAAGIVFGFAALKPVLISEGVYRDLCTEDELREDVEVCYGQEMRLDLFFAVASTTTNISALPVGTILDRYGPRLCNIVGSILLAIGSIFMAFPLPKVDNYIIGNLFLSLGGTFVFVPSFQIANAFPRYAGTIVALVTGAFDASAAVFLFYRLAYQATGGAIGLKKFFGGYLIIPGLILLVQTIMPAHGYQSVQQLEVKIEQAQDATRDVHDSDDEIESETELWRVRSRRAECRQQKKDQLDQLLGDEEVRQQRVEREEEKQAVSGVWGVLHGQPARKQMLSPWFILINLMTVLQMLRMNYFIATVRQQYEYMLRSERQAVRINHFFDVALPVGGVASTPFIGILLDSFSVPTMLAVIVVLTTLVGALNCVPSIGAGYATVIIFVLLRPLYYSAMSDYAAKVFGFATFGRIYGTIICLSGIVNFSQYGLNALTYKTFHGDPIPINIGLVVGGFVIGVILVTFVHVEGYRIRRRQLEEEAEEERERLIPEECEPQEA